MTAETFYYILVGGNTTNRKKIMDEELIPKLTKQTLVEDFITKFEKMIISGQLAIGEKLPSERDLAEKLGVSRPVVHEGMIDLETKGLITRSSRGGAVVNDYRKDGSLFLLNSFLKFQDGLIEPLLAESTLEFRMLVEVECARLAALNRTKTNLNEMESILAKEKEIDLSKTAALTEIDFAFHHLIAMATDNIFFPLLLNSFKSLYLNGSLVFFSDPVLTREAFDFHQHLYSAIQDQNDQEAIRIMHNMLEHGKTGYLKLISDSPQKEK